MGKGDTAADDERRVTRLYTNQDPMPVGLCPACGEFLWPGDPVWRGQGKILCQEHMDCFGADYMGLFASQTEAEDGKNL